MYRADLDQFTREEEELNVARAIHHADVLQLSKEKEELRIGQEAFRLERAEFDRAVYAKDVRANRY